MFVPLSIFLQKASGVALVVLSGLLAYQLALVTWSLSPVQDSKYQWVTPKVETTNNGSKINTQTLQQQHLFGEHLISETAVKKNGFISAAPKTKLNVVLVGVVAASDPDYSSAIISYKSKQDSYFIDSKIEGTSASVSEIYEDRVILDVNGVLQTLMLDGIDNVEQQDNHQAKAVISNKSKVKPVDVAIDRSALLKDPGKLTDYIRISPYRKDGQVAGYRLKPGKDRTLFDQAGLKNGDLAIELNGADLTDMQQAFSLMKVFPTMTEMSLTVERDGQLHELYLNIP